MMMFFAAGWHNEAEVQPRVKTHFFTGSNCSLSISASLTACTAAQAEEEGSLHVRKIASYCSMNNPTGSRLAVCHSKLNSQVKLGQVRTLAG